MKKKLLLQFILVCLFALLPSCEDSSESAKKIPYGRHSMYAVFFDEQGRNLVENILEKAGENWFYLEKDAYTLSVSLNGKVIVDQKDEPRLSVFIYEGRKVLNIYVQEIEDHVDNEAYYNREEPMTIEYLITSHALFGDNKQHSILAEWKNVALTRTRIDGKDLEVWWVLKVFVNRAEAAQKEQDEADALSGL